MFDAEVLPLVESITAQLESVERFIVLTDRASMPSSAVLTLECLEELIEATDDDYRWPQFDERAASSLCYTSGTTGNPKGVLFSHRSTLIHALASLQPDVFGLRCTDVVMSIAPMFHVNAWSLPYSCPMAGAKLVLPGSRMDPAHLFDLIESERVTFASAVPTIWTLLIAWLKEQRLRFTTLERTAIGGTALPPAVERALREDFGIATLHAWGMTETSPIGTVASPTPEICALPESQQRAQLLKQGRVPFGVEMKILDSEGRTAPPDGTTFGPLWVRGPWVASGYFKGEGGDVLDADGWFPTGDVATWDEFGFMRITDRTKDVIKSGGEWISSIEVENAAMSHPQVKLAAAVAAYHPKWDERPVLIVVAAPEATPSRDEILEFLAARMAKWWLPDDVVFVSEMPMTATGKILKSRLRERYWNHLKPAG
jgi:fatty-acyl-CoA synthase